MAKKKAKKAAKKARRAPVRKATRTSTKPKAVTTGRGPGPAQIGQDLVAMFNRGEFHQIEDKWWSPKVVSVEGVGVAQAWSGRKAVEAKNAQWMERNRIVSARAEGPFIGASGFAVKFEMEVEDKGTGQRTAMEEVGVYQVKNGKIVREEFMYGSMRPIGAAPAPAADLAPIGG